MNAPGPPAAWTPPSRGETARGASFDDDGWSDTRYDGSSRPDAASRRAPRTSGLPYPPSGEPDHAFPAAARSAPAATRPERGLAGWQAVSLLIVITGIGGAIDLIFGSSLRGGFNIALVVASLVAILVVRHSRMFSVIVSPPLVYAGFSAGILYVRTNGSNNRNVLLDAASNWLVYGFPAIASATAVVLLVAAVRLLRGRR